MPGGSVLPATAAEAQALMSAYGAQAVRLGVYSIPVIIGVTLWQWKEQAELELAIEITRGNMLTIQLIGYEAINSNDGCQCRNV